MVKSLAPWNFTVKVWPTGPKKWQYLSNGTNEDITRQNLNWLLGSAQGIFEYFYLDDFNSRGETLWQKGPTVLWKGYPETSGQLYGWMLREIDARLILSQKRHTNGKKPTGELCGRRNKR